MVSRTTFCMFSVGVGGSVCMLVLPSPIHLYCKCSLVFIKSKHDPEFISHTLDITIHHSLPPVGSSHQIGPSACSLNNPVSHLQARNITAPTIKFRISISQHCVSVMSIFPKKIFSIVSWWVGCSAPPPLPPPLVRLALVLHPRHPRSSSYIPITYPQFRSPNACELSRAGGRPTSRSAFATLFIYGLWCSFELRAFSVYVDCVCFRYILFSFFFLFIRRFAWPSRHPEVHVEIAAWNVTNNRAIFGLMLAHANGVCGILYS